MLLTNHLEISFTGAHWVRVDLAHVPAPVRLLHLLDVQVPGAMVIVRKRNPGILRNHFVVNGEDCLCVHAHPRQLERVTRAETVVN